MNDRTPWYIKITARYMALIYWHGLSDFQVPVLLVLVAMLCMIAWWLV